MFTLLLLPLLFSGSSSTRIASTDEFISFMSSVNSGTNYSGTTVFLDSDIDFAGQSSKLAPIGNTSDYLFLGEFNGRGHIISNFVIESSLQYTGLFGYSEGATFKDVVIDESCSVVNTFISSDDTVTYIGGLIGKCNSVKGSCMVESVVNMGTVSFEGNVTHDLFFGGIVGALCSVDGFENAIRNCINYGHILDTGTYRYNHVGGLLGATEWQSTSVSYLVNSLNYGTLSINGKTCIEKTNSYFRSFMRVGGISGESYKMNIENCLSVGKIKIGERNIYFHGSIEGIANENTNISHCYWTSDTGKDFACGQSYSEFPVTGSSLAQMDQTTLTNLNGYVETKGTTWGKWLMLHMNGGRILNFTYNEMIAAQKNFPVPVKEGNTFLFWCKDAGCDTQYNPKTETGSVTDLYAGWMINTVTFDFGNGTVVERSFSYDEAIVYPVGLVKEGYTFGEWDNKPERMPARNLTIKALWVINSYTVTFNFDNGTVPEERIFEFNTSIEYPKNLVNEGYTFGGWDNAPERMPAENITIKATWTEAISSKTVEIVFGRNDLEDEEVKEIIREYTDEEIVIESIDRDPETGEIRVIVKFTDEQKAEEFVREMNVEKRSGSPVKKINSIAERDVSFSPQTAISSFLFIVLFFFSFFL